MGGYPCHSTGMTCVVRKFIIRGIFADNRVGGDPSSAFQSDVVHDEPNLVESDVKAGSFCDSELICCAGPIFVSEPCPCISMLCVRKNQ